jgi:hypothetical protein
MPCCDAAKTFGRPEMGQPCGGAFIASESKASPDRSGFLVCQIAEPARIAKNASLAGLGDELVLSETVYRSGFASLRCRTARHQFSPEFFTPAKKFRGYRRPP